MQDPNADTEWNDALRRHNILPPRASKEAEVTEADVVRMVEDTVREKTSNAKSLDGMTLDDLDAFEDEEDERVLQAYRMKRMMEMKEAATKSKFGDVREISGEDYVQEVNKAGQGIWVVLHLYQQGLPLCALINQHLSLLAQKFPQTKFLKSISTLCIRDYPDKNLPTLFIYHDGNMKKQFVGPHEFGGTNLTAEGLEWMLSGVGAVKSDIEAPSKRVIRDVLTSALGSTANTISDDGDIDENDW